MIDEYWTWQFYGYHSYDLKPQSNRPIVARCDECCEHRISTNHTYRNLCKICSHKGHHHTEETKHKMSISHTRKILTEEHKHNISKAHKGKILTYEHRKKLSENHADFSGENNPMYGIREENAPGWMGGIASESNIFRASLEYSNWRSAVLKRDDCTCQECGTKDISNHVHHILPYRDYKCPEYAFNINNGITLCKKCHGKTIRKEYEFVEHFKAIIRA